MRASRKLFPTDKRSGVGKSVDIHCSSCRNFAEAIDDQYVSVRGSCEYESLFWNVDRYFINKTVPHYICEMSLHLSDFESRDLDNCFWYGVTKVMQQ